MTWTVKRRAQADSQSKTVTLGEVLDAIEQNGLPQAHGAFWRFNTKRKADVESACAIGQGALNLGCDYSELTHQLGTIHLSKGRTLDGSIIQRNDSSKWSVKRIARYYRYVLRDRLGESISINKNYTVEKG